MSEPTGSCRTTWEQPRELGPMVPGFTGSSEADHIYFFEEDHSGIRQDWGLEKQFGSDFNSPGENAGLNQGSAGGEIWVDLRT